MPSHRTAATTLLCQTESLPDTSPERDDDDSVDAPATRTLMEATEDQAGTTTTSTINSSTMADETNQPKHVNADQQQQEEANERVTATSASSTEIMHDQDEPDNDDNV